MTAQDQAQARALPTAEELELARVLELATKLWAELKDCDWPMTRLGLALAEAEERGKAAARAEGARAATERAAKIAEGWRLTGGEGTRIARAIRAGETGEGRP